MLIEICLLRGHIRSGGSPLMSYSAKAVCIVTDQILSQAVSTWSYDCVCFDKIFALECSVPLRAPSNLLFNPDKFRVSINSIYKVFYLTYHTVHGVNPTLAYLFILTYTHSYSLIQPCVCSLPFEEDPTVIG